VQVHPITPALKPPGTKRLKLKYEKVLSKFAFNFNLRHHTPAGQTEAALDALFALVGRCRLSL